MNELFLTAADLFSYLQHRKQVVNVSLCMGVLKMGDMTFTRHIFLTTLNCALPLGFSLITQDLGLVMNAIGSYCGAILGFIYPGMLYIGAHWEDIPDILKPCDEQTSANPVSRLWGRIYSMKDFYLAGMLAVYGTFLFATGIPYVFIN